MKTFLCVNHTSSPHRTPFRIQCAASGCRKSTSDGILLSANLISPDACVALISSKFNQFGHIVLLIDRRINIRVDRNKRRFYISHVTLIVYNRIR